MNKNGLGWILPLFSVRSWSQLVLFILFLSLLLMIAASISVRREKKNIRWLMLMEYALRRGLSSEQIELLHGFFRLTGSSVHREESGFRRLMAYLNTLDATTAKNGLKILVLLFQHVVTGREPLKELAGIRTGELALVTGNDAFFYATSMKTGSGYLVLYSPFHGKNLLGVSKEYRVCIFRPGQGEFIFNAELDHVRDKLLTFLVTGKIDPVSRHPLMSPVPCTGELVLLPKYHPPGKLPSSCQETPARSDNIQLKIRTVKIAGSVLTFIFSDREGYRTFLQHPSGSWELNLHLEDGKLFVCDGKAMRTSRSYPYFPEKFDPGEYSVFIFRYSHPDRTGILELKNWISRNEPVPEDIYVK